MQDNRGGRHMLGRAAKQNPNYTVGSNTKSKSIKVLSLQTREPIDYKKAMLAVKGHKQLYYRIVT
jgi:hypothetical protein